MPLALFYGLNIMRLHLKITSLISKVTLIWAAPFDNNINIIKLMLFTGSLSTLSQPFLSAVDANFLVHSAYSKYTRFVKLFFLCVQLYFLEFFLIVNFKVCYSPPTFLWRILLGSDGLSVSVDFLNALRFLLLCSSNKQGPSVDTLLPGDEQAWRLHLDADLCYRRLLLEERRRTEHHLRELCHQVRLPLEE